ncbi:MAG: hypothetical protein ACOCP4_05190 [Candidatus Woesearchaeota archaeon]
MRKLFKSNFNIFKILIQHFYGFYSGNKFGEKGTVDFQLNKFSLNLIMIK